jgi:hypothetical protein
MPDQRAAENVPLQREGDQASDPVAAKDHRGEAARDDCEKEGSGDGILHRRSPGTAGPGSVENEAGTRVGQKQWYDIISNGARESRSMRGARERGQCGLRLPHRRLC